MNYSEEYISLCKRLGELMEVVPEVRWQVWNESEKEFATVLTTIDDERVKVYDEWNESEWWDYDFDDNHNPPCKLVFIPPLSWLVRELTKRDMNWRLQPSFHKQEPWWELQIGVSWNPESTTAPTPEEAVLRALIAALEGIS